MTLAPRPSIAVVTDSSAGLDPIHAGAAGIRVVPLQLVIGARSYADGIDPEASPLQIAAALAAFVPVSTSRPSPEAVQGVYRELADEGIEQIVSIHLSAEVSATFESAQLAARNAPVPVLTIDSRQVGYATGYAALAAAGVVGDGGTAEEAAATARSLAARCTSLFYVDTLEHLRRSGRVSAIGAVLGSALAVKPILEIVGGRIVPKEKVRTSSRALARLETLALEAASDLGSVDVTVCHLANLAGAEALAAALEERLGDVVTQPPFGDRLGGGSPVDAAPSGDVVTQPPFGDPASGKVKPGRRIVVREVPAVIGAHVGPGLVGVVLAPSLGTPS